MSSSEATAGRAAYKESLESDLKAVDGHMPSADMLGGQWANMVWPGSPEALEFKNPETGVPLDELRRIGMTSVQAPANFVRMPRCRLHLQMLSFAITWFRKCIPVSSDTFPLALIASSRVKE